MAKLLEYMISTEDEQIINDPSPSLDTIRKHLPWNWLLWNHIPFATSTLPLLNGCNGCNLNFLHIRR